MAIYSRKSIETDTGESIKNQINICKDYFTSKYANCSFEIFEDEGFSGSNINRPSFKKMMTMAKSKQFNIIAVYKLDRIARNIVDFVNIYDELEKVSIRLISITEGFDPGTPIGKMMMLLLASFAEMERMNIAQRIKDNMCELAKMGRWSGGTPPIGYNTKKVIEDGKEITYLELIKDLSFDIKYIFESYSKGHSTYKISKDLKDKGLSYPNKTILNILKNPTYLSSTNESIKYLKSQGYICYGEPNGLGFLPYNRRPKTNGKKVTISSERFVGVSKHESIIDLNLWRSVQEILNVKRISPHTRKSNLTYLSGIIKCTCGSTMYIDPGKYRKDGTRLYYFRCPRKKSEVECNNKSIRLDIIEGHIIAYFKKISSNKNDIYKLLKYSDTSSITDRINIIKSKIIKNNNSINNLLNRLSLIASDASNIVTNKINEIANQTNSLKKELLSLEREHLFNESNLYNLDIIYTKILYFLENKDLPLDEKHLDVKLIIDYIIWDSENNKLLVRLNV